MSESSVRGKSFERLVSKMIRSKLKLKIARDRRSGAGINKSDMSDYYGELPLTIECKDQKTIKILEWYRQVKAVSNFNSPPAVVFRADSEVLVTLKFDDLLNFLAEIADQKAEIDSLREPRHITANELQPAMTTLHDLQPAVAKKVKGGQKTCRNGHLADEYGYCQQLTCKYSRGYRPPKVKRS